MSYKRTLVQNYLILFVVYLMCLVWMPFPKSIIGTIGGKTFLFDLLTNILWYSCLAVLLLLSIKSILKINSLTSIKHYTIAIFICIATQLLLDIVKFVVSGIFKDYASIVGDLITVFFWLIVVLAICKYLKCKSIDTKKFVCIYLGTTLLLVIIFVVFNIVDIQKIQLAEEKYSYLSSKLMDIAVNLDFVYGIRNAIFDYMCGCIAMLTLCLSSSIANVCKRDEGNNKGRSFAVLSIRIFAVLILAFAVCAVKIIAIPHNSLKATSINKDISSRSGFYEDCKVVENVRATNYGGHTKTVFAKTSVKLYYSGQELLTYYIDGKYHSKTMQIDGNSIIMNDNLETIDMDGTQVVISFDRAAAYIENDIPYAIEFKKLTDTERNETILNICKFMLEDGRFECFEYVGEYVAKYDFEFAKPYIERYAKGDFTNEEIANNQNINLQYITKTAQSLLQ